MEVALRRPNLAVLVFLLWICCNKLRFMSSKHTPALNAIAESWASPYEDQDILTVAKADRI